MSLVRKPRLPLRQEVRFDHARGDVVSFNMSLREMLARELTLEEMLGDPIVRLVMKRDGVSEGEIRKLMTRQAETRAA